MTFPSYLNLEPIDPIEGDPSEIRQHAHDLRRLTDRLDIPRQAAVSLQAVRHSAVWDGNAFLAFLTLIEKLPKPGDIDNAVDRFHWLASELETFADVLDDCQAENRRCRRELDEANPPDVELTDEVLSTMSGISLQASQALERLDEASLRLRDTFDAMDQLTKHAEPPPGVLERVGNGFEAFQVWEERVRTEFVIGIGVGAWEMVKGVGMLAFYLNPAMLPFTAPKLWKNRETVKAVATFARQHPRLFATEMGKAVVDWETLDESPARWVGKMVPDLLLGMATAGSGTFASKGAVKTVSALKRIDHVADAGQDLSRAARMLERSRALFARTRIALHDGVTAVDDMVNPWLEGSGLRMLRPRGTLVDLGIRTKPTQVKNLVTGGWYSRMRTTDRYINGIPGMNRPELVSFVGTRALSSGGRFNELQERHTRFDALASTTEPVGAGPSADPSDPGVRSGPPPPADLTPDPVPRPDVRDPAPAPPPRRYQTTSSAGPP